VVPNTLVEALFSVCYSGSYDKLDAKVQELLCDGYSVTQLLLQFHDMLVTMDTITDSQKSVIAERMGVSL
jgi:replication factor C subunit 2/4